ncbi:kinesin motor protein [Carex littledalei]|uniref:Kinesin motor protein n=1 Tax=Carex littledalei TaxID=544730 RepID=A0A833VU53_9POAL|nr:kinesin motor protein [Carex littledalei]
MRKQITNPYGFSCRCLLYFVYELWRQRNRGDCITSRMGSSVRMTSPPFLKIHALKEACDRDRRTHSWFWKLHCLIPVCPIVSGLDIYKIVGANRALQIVDIRASVVLNEPLVINFQSLTGSPIICGIAVRKAPALPRSTGVYADASPLVTSVLDGYNVCIFAYGQTGTGKTFTMEGTERKRGVNYRTLEELFKIAEERKETVSYDISVSVLEVYNEQIRDLLNSNPSSKKLEIRQAGREGLHHIPGVVEAKVESTEEVWDVLQAGSNARAVGSNNINEYSSRSHWLINQSPTFVLN